MSCTTWLKVELCAMRCNMALYIKLQLMMYLKKINVLDLKFDETVTTNLLIWPHSHLWLSFVIFDLPFFKKWPLMVPWWILRQFDDLTPFWLVTYFCDLLPTFQKWANINLWWFHDEFWANLIIWPHFVPVTYFCDPWPTF